MPGIQFGLPFNRKLLKECKCLDQLGKTAGIKLIFDKVVVNERIDSVRRAEGLYTRQDPRVRHNSDYLGFGLGGFWIPVVSYAPRPMSTTSSSLVINDGFMKSDR